MAERKRAAGKYEYPQRPTARVSTAECWIASRPSPGQQGQSGRSVAVQNTAVLFGLSRLEVCDGRVLMMQEGSLLRAPRWLTV
eukprot:COSAG06_NODE_21263_length_763_cov_1.326807_2_plen_82_part_01